MNQQDNTGQPRECTESECEHYVEKWTNNCEVRACAKGCIRMDSEPSLSKGAQKRLTKKMKRNK